MSCINLAGRYDLSGKQTTPVIGQTVKTEETVDCVKHDSGAYANFARCEKCNPEHQRAKQSETQ